MAPAESSCLIHSLLYLVTVPKVGQSRPASGTALRRRRSWGFGRWCDVGPWFLTDEGVFFRAHPVIPETTNLSCCHGYTSTISTIYR